MPLSTEWLPAAGRAITAPTAGSTSPNGRGPVMWGHTQEAMMNAALDRISRAETERANALEEITAFIAEHPEHEDDDHLVVARLALL